jgi:hypothetical protein
MNLFYDPVPFEMLKTYETKPQVMVSVDGLPAVCHNLECDYAFVEPVGEITSFTYDEATKKLVITGTELPYPISEIQSVEFAKSYCTVDNSTLTNTTIECTLDHDPTCGDEVPIVTSIHGRVPHADTVNTQRIECTIT